MTVNYHFITNKFNSKKRHEPCKFLLRDFLSVLKSVASSCGSLIGHLLLLPPTRWVAPSAPVAPRTNQNFKRVKKPRAQCQAKRFTGKPIRGALHSTFLLRSNPFSSLLEVQRGRPAQSGLHGPDRLARGLSPQEKQP